MPNSISRRAFGGVLGGAVAMTALGAPAAAGDLDFRLRTITAGVPLEDADDPEPIESAVRFLKTARDRFADAGFEIQTLRIATRPLAAYLPDFASGRGLDRLARLASMVGEAGVILGVGPVSASGMSASDFAAFAGEMTVRAEGVSFALDVAGPGHGVDRHAVRAAGAAMAAIARRTPHGEGNFNFAAAAFVPPGTPFFPAARHSGREAFSIGLESPGLLLRAFSAADGVEEGRAALTAALNRALAPVAELGRTIAAETGRRYLGIDTSPAPGLGASIGAAIETLTGVPFGHAGTLAGCAAITDALKSVSVETCGYSGLMLPVLEDRVLAQRAAEGAYRISDLLLYSSVCGTGLDTVPLPGDTPAEALSAIVGDVAALAAKYQKPLSVRLLPVPGRQAGDRVAFDNPFLTDSVALAIP